MKHMHIVSVTFLVLLTGAVFAGGASSKPADAKSSGMESDPEAQALLSKVEIQYPQEYKDNPMVLKGEVAVTLANGVEYSHKIDVPKGDDPNPMTREELSAKFKDCTHLSLTQKEIEEVLRTIHNLDSLGSISELMNRITYTAKSSE